MAKPEKAIRWCSLFALLGANVLAAQASLDNQPWSLHYAAAHRQTNVVEMLLRMGVDANASDLKGDHALNIACLRGDPATARLLLEHGANPNLRNREGATPLPDAALNGNVEVIGLLLDKGAEVNAVESESRSTALHYAASFGRLEAARLLIKSGADASIKNAKGEMPLQLAERNKHDDVATILRGLPKPL